MQETVLRHVGHAHRGIHAKSHALLEGELEVLPDLPPELAQGMFARPGRYPVVLRLSSNRPDILDDDIGVPRGLGMKVIGVDGPRLDGAEAAPTQDWIMVNQPFFTEPDLRVFVRNIRFVDATAQTGLLWKKIVAALLRPPVALVRALGGHAATPTTMGGHPLTHPLGETYFTQVPFRYGGHVAKLALAPTSAALRALTSASLDHPHRPNAIREAVIAHFERHGGEWDFRVQLRTNTATMPIEDASARWPESESPFRTVARLTVPPQPAWSEARAAAVDDRLAFSPWNGLEAHRPLGSVNRARREAYAEGAAFRAERNRCPIHRPAARVALPDAPAEIFGHAPGREGRRSNTPDAIPGTLTNPMRPTARVLNAVAPVAIGAALIAVARRPVARVAVPLIRFGALLTLAAMADRRRRPKHLPPS